MICQPLQGRSFKPTISPCNIIHQAHEVVNLPGILLCACLTECDVLCVDRVVLFSELTAFGYVNCWHLWYARSFLSGKGEHQHGYGIHRVACYIRSSGTRTA